MNSDQKKQELITVLHKINPEKYNFDELGDIFNIPPAEARAIYEEHRKDFLLDDFFMKID